MTTRTHQFPIIVVADNPKDIILYKRTFERLGITNPIVFLVTAERAIEYLKTVEANSRSAPGLIVMELRMPDGDGFQVLRWLQEHPTFSIVPTVVMTTSASLEETTTAYKWGANAVFAKPATSSRREHLLRVVLEFWSIAAKSTPPRESWR